MKKIKELSLFLIGIVAFSFGWVVSVIIEIFPGSTENMVKFFGDSYYIKNIFTDNLIFKAIINTYFKAFIPSAICMLAFIVLLLFLKNKPSRKVFYLVSFFVGTFSSFSYFFLTRLFDGMPEYLYHAAMTIVIHGSGFFVSKIAGLLCSLFFALFIGTLLTFVCWIVELVFKKLENSHLKG